jgi:hypothetical protein
LWRGHQNVPLLRREPVGLDGVHHVFRLVEIGVAKLRRPWGIFRQIVEHRRKLRQAFDGRVPGHGVRPGGALIRRQRQVRVQPGIRRGNLIRIGGCRQHLSHQRVWIEGKRRH